MEETKNKVKAKDGFAVRALDPALNSVVCRATYQIFRTEWVSLRNGDDRRRYRHKAQARIADVLEFPLVLKTLRRGIGVVG